MSQKNADPTRVRQRREIARRSLIGLAAVAAVAVLLYVGVQYLESRAYDGEPVRGDLSSLDGQEHIVEYGGRQYRYNDNIVTVLFMGVDQDSDAAGTTGNYRNGGQADFLMLLAIDHAHKTVTEFHIDRDAMAEITVLGVLGNKAGTREAQICLSHSFGDGAAQSNELTREAVQRLLYGIDIDFYVAMNLDAIPVINDAVGGVTVTIAEDFSAHDPSMTLGAQVKLDGEQTELYVRRRMDVGDGTNAARMRRQESYLAALVDTIGDRVEADAGYVGRLFDMSRDVILTDMTRGRMINEANRASGYDKAGGLSLVGEHKVGTDGFMQFWVDQEALEETILSLYYIPVD